MSTKKNQLSINVKLKKNDEMVESTIMYSKTKILNWVQGESISEWDTGYVRVTYSYKNQFYNHSFFSNLDQLKLLLEEMTDPSLVKTFCS